VPPPTDRQADKDRRQSEVPRSIWGASGDGVQRSFLLLSAVHVARAPRCCRLVRRVASRAWKPVRTLPRTRHSPDTPLDSASARRLCTAPLGPPLPTRAPPAAPSTTRPIGFTHRRWQAFCRLNAAAIFCTWRNLQAFRSTTPPHTHPAPSAARLLCVGRCACAAGVHVLPSRRVLPAGVRVLSVAVLGDLPGRVRLASARWRRGLPSSSAREVPDRRARPTRSRRSSACGANLDALMCHRAQIWLSANVTSDECAVTGVPFAHAAR